jgi:hypothetical protein
VKPRLLSDGSLQGGKVFHQRPFRVSGVGVKLPAEQIAGPVVLRRSVGQHGVDDSGGLMSDSGRTSGMLCAGCQVIAILVLRSSWS